jgi:hypothetical protein
MLLMSSFGAAASIIAGIVATAVPIDYVYALHFAASGEAVGCVGFWVNFH